MKSLIQYIKESLNNDMLLTLTAKREKGRFIATDTLYQEALDKFGEGATVINPAYTNYGGTIMDKVLIRYYEENLPDLMVYENTAWGGENAICLPGEGFDPNDVFYGYPDMEDLYYGIEYELHHQEADYFCSEYGYEDRKEEIIDWFANYGHVEPNMIDYNYDELIEYLENNKEE